MLSTETQYGADFVHALDTFVANSGNLQATARELSAHVKSVTYRLQRIQAISGLDLEQAQDRLQAQSRAQDSQ